MVLLAMLHIPPRRISTVETYKTDPLDATKKAIWLAFTFWRAADIHSKQSDNKTETGYKKMSICVMSESATLKMSIRVESTFDISQHFLDIVKLMMAIFGRCRTQHPRNQTQRACCQLDTYIYTLRRCTLLSTTGSGVGDTEASTLANRQQSAKWTCHITTTTTPITNVIISVNTLYIWVFEAIVLSLLIQWSLR